MSFEKFLYSSNRIKESQKLFNNYINESFDTFFKITHVEKLKNVEFHYFNINDSMYRIYIERVDDDISIGFEYQKENEYHMHGIRNKLSLDEVLRIFGTIYKLIIDNKFNALYICSEEQKKYDLYEKMMNKLLKRYKDYELHGDGKCLILKKHHHINTTQFTYKGQK